MNLDDVVAVQVAVARPGDTLFIAFQRSITAEEAHRIKERCTSVAPGINIAIIDGVGVMAVSQAEISND